MPYYPPASGGGGGGVINGAGPNVIPVSDGTNLFPSVIKNDVAGGSIDISTFAELYNVSIYNYAYEEFYSGVKIISNGAGDFAFFVTGAGINGDPLIGCHSSATDEANYTEFSSVVIDYGVIKRGQDVAPAAGANNNFRVTAAALDINSVAGAMSFTGFVMDTGKGDETTGSEFSIMNRGSSNVTLKNNDAGSTDANRILIAGGADLVIRPNGGAILRYSNEGVANGKWRVIAAFA